MRHLLKMDLLLLRFLDFWRNVKVALLHPFEDPEDEHSDDDLQAKADKGAQLPAKFSAKDSVDSGHAS